VPRLCIVYPGICLTTEENHGKPQSVYSIGARLISAERDSFSRLGHLLTMASTGLLAPASLGFRIRRRESTLGQRRYRPIFRTREFPTSANFESKFAVRSLMWSAISGNPDPFGGVRSKAKTLGL
jgi:hypothetical protein